MVLVARVEVETGGEAGGAEKAAEKAAGLARCGPVVLEPSTGSQSWPWQGEDKDGAQRKAWERLLSRMAAIVGPIKAADAECVTEWLNAGATHALLTGTSEEIAALAAELPAARLVAIVDDLDAVDEQSLATLAASVSSVAVEVPDGAKLVDFAARCWSKFGAAFPGGISLRCGGDVEADRAARNAAVGALHHLNGSDHPVHVQSNAVQLPTDAEEKDEDAAATGFCLGASLVACLKTDRPDGLYTTVVTDELGVALGLVYSSPASVKASLACGRAVYFSRSRQELWRKGDTSGKWQELVSIAFDCDADALRFSVRQLGEPPVFCHQGVRSCWGADGGLGHLQRTLQSRKASAPEGSYTKRLFDDRTLLRNKMLEEAQEVIEAVEEDDAWHVAEEVADLTYFMLTAGVAGGASLEDVCNVLEQRSRKVKRRPGNAKAERIQAAEAALSGGTSK